MASKAPWSMIVSGKAPQKFWVVTITHIVDGEPRLNDVRAYMTDAGAKYFYGYTLNNWARLARYAHNRHWLDGAVVTLTEYAADTGTVLKTHTNKVEGLNNG